MADTTKPAQFYKNILAPFITKHSLALSEDCVEEDNKILYNRLVKMGVKEQKSLPAFHKCLERYLKKGMFDKYKIVKWSDWEEYAHMSKEDFIKGLGCLDEFDQVLIKPRWTSGLSASDTEDSDEEDFVPFVIPGEDTQMKLPKKVEETPVETPVEPASPEIFKDNIPTPKPKKEKKKASPKKTTKKTTPKKKTSRSPQRVWNSEYNPELCGCRLNTCDKDNYYGQCQKPAEDEGGYCKTHTRQYIKKGWFRFGDVRTFGVGTFNDELYWKSAADQKFLNNVAIKMCQTCFSDTPVPYTDNRPDDIKKCFPIVFTPPHPPE